MDDPREALHTLARHHCIEQHRHWADLYRELEAKGKARRKSGPLSWEYTDQAYATFPRYLVWEAILAEVERIEAQSVPDTDGLREELVAAGSRAQTGMTSNVESSPVACASMAEERTEFAGFVRAVQDRQLQVVEPLPVRRVFANEELQRLWKSLDTHWDVNTQHYWWPLREGTPPSHSLVFHTDWFDGEKQAFLRKALSDHGVDLVFELREFGEWGAEQSVGDFEPVYNGEEGYWTSSTSDWLVYASHESSITVAGEWLVRSVRQRFSTCDEFSYRGPMRTPDRRGTWSG